MAKSIIKSPFRIQQTASDVGRQLMGEKPSEGYDLPLFGKVEGYGRQFLDEAGENAGDWTDPNTIRAGLEAVSQGVLDASFLGSVLEKQLARQVLKVPKVAPPAQTPTPNSEKISLVKKHIFGDGGKASYSGAESIIGKGEIGMSKSSELLEYAKGRLDDVAMKLGKLDPRLEQVYRAQVKPNASSVETAMKTILDPAKKIIDAYEKGGLSDSLLTALTRNLPKATQEYIREPKLGLGIKDVSKDLAQEVRLEPVANFESRLRRTAPNQPEAYYKAQVEDYTNKVIAQEARKYKSKEEFVKDKAIVKSLLPKESIHGPQARAKFTGETARVGDTIVDRLPKVLEEGKKLDDVGGDGSVGNYASRQIEKLIKNGRLTVYHGTTEATADILRGNVWSKLNDGSYLSLTKDASREALGVYGAGYYKNLASKYGVKGEVLKFDIPVENIGVDRVTGELRFINPNTNLTKSQLTDIWNEANKK